MRIRFLILAVIVSFSWLSRAEVPSLSLPQAKTAFEKHVPRMEFRGDMTAFGDINGDEIIDFVTFIGPPTYISNRGDEDLKAAVFLGTKDNTFNFYEVSSKILGGERAYREASHALEIKKQSIFLRQHGRSGCCGFWSKEFRFKIRNGQLMLIGVETEEFQEETPEEIAIQTGVSINLLTRQLIKWTIKDNKMQEKKATVPILKPVLFKNFGYEEFLMDRWQRCCGDASPWPGLARSVEFVPNISAIAPG